MKKKIVIVGIGSNVEEVIYFIKKYDLFEIVGFLVDERYLNSPEFYGLPVYPLEKIEEYYSPEEVNIYVAISWYNYLNKYKKEKYDILKKKGYRFANLISPNALIHTDNIGEGNWIMDSVYIGYNCSIGNNNVFIQGANISHYVTIGNHNFFGANCTVLGHVSVDERCFIGSSSIVNNRIHIEKMCVVGSGTLIKKDMKPYSMSIAQKSKVIQLDDNSIELVISPMK